jgi:hypothetical protein
MNMNPFDPPGDLDAEGRDRTRRAIGALAAWTDTANDKEQYPLLVRYLAEEAPTGVEATELMVGYHNLAAHLLLLLEGASGLSRHEILRRLAEGYA